MGQEPSASLDGSAIARRHLGSPRFVELYRSHMRLVEDMVAYLDVEGRREARLLERKAASDYAAMTRQLTDGAFRIATALLLLRAVKNGEMPFSDAMSDIASRRVTESPRAAISSLDGLPRGLLELAVRCDAQRLEIIGLLDFLGHGPRSNVNAVHASLGLIHSAFSR